MGCGLSQGISFTKRKEQHSKGDILPNAAHESSHRNQASGQLDDGEGSHLLATADSALPTPRAPPTEIGGPTPRSLPSANDSSFDQRRFVNGPRRLMHAYREERLAGARSMGSMQCTVLDEYSAVGDSDAVRRQLRKEGSNRFYGSNVNTLLCESVQSTETEGTPFLRIPEKAPGRLLYATSGAASTLMPSDVAPAERAVAWGANAKGLKAPISAKELIPRAAKLRASLSSSAGEAEALAPPAQFIGGGRSRGELPVAPDRSTSPVARGLAVEDASLRSTDARGRWAGTTFDTAADWAECRADMFLNREHDWSDIMRTAEGSLMPSWLLSADQTLSEKVKGVMSKAPASLSRIVNIGSFPSKRGESSAPLGISLGPTSTPALPTTGSFEGMSRKSRQSSETLCRSVPLYSRNCSRGRWGQSLESDTGNVALQNVYDLGENTRYSFCAYSSDDMDPFRTSREDVLMRRAREENNGSLNTPEAHRVRQSSCSDEWCDSLNECENTKSASSEDDDDNGPGSLAHKTSANSDVAVGSAMSLLRAFTTARKERRRIVKIVELTTLPDLETKMPANPILKTKSAWNDHLYGPPGQPPMLPLQHRQRSLHCVPLTQPLQHTTAVSSPLFRRTGPPAASGKNDDSPKQPVPPPGRRRMVTRANSLPRTFGDS